MKFCHNLPRNFVYQKHRQRTQLSSGYTYYPLQLTVWYLRCFEVLIQFRTGYGQIGLQVFGQGFGLQDG
jgi:hypothetical protein